MSAAPTTARRVGRPRDPEVDRRVLAATRELLGTSGYAQVSIDAVARLAGVGRPTIYRRWPSKAELVHDAVFREVASAGYPPSSNLRRDLRTWVTTTADLFCDPVGQAAITGLLGELRERPDLREALRSGLERTSRAQLDEMVRGAAQRGEIRADIDAGALFDALAGAVLFWALVDGGIDRPRFEQRLVDLLNAALEPRPS
jgi:AcrR family transcriptional regulator